MIRDSLISQHTFQLNAPLSTTVFFSDSFRARLEKFGIFIQAVDSEKKQVTHRWERESGSETKGRRQKLGKP